MNTDGGFINWIILIIIALIVLSYFGLNLQEIVEDDTTQGNFSYAWNFVSEVWEEYLHDPFVWIWDNIIQDVLWEALQNLLNLAEGRPDALQESAPGIDAG